MKAPLGRRVSANVESIVAQVAAAAVTLTTPTTPTCDPQRILVKLASGAAPVALGPIALAAGVELERALPHINVYVMRARAGDVGEALAVLRRHPMVGVAERDIGLSTVEISPKDFDS